MTDKSTTPPQPNNPEKSLVASMITSSHAADILEKIGEVPFDVLCSNDVIKEIPVLGLGISLYRAGNTIAAHLLTKKIMIFLSEVEKIPAEKRREFFEQSVGNEENQKIGETLLLSIEKLDNYNLAKMLGIAVRLLANGEISKQSYEACTHAIKQLNPYLIDKLHGIYANEGLQISDSISPVALSNCGLVNLKMRAPNVNEREVEASIDKNHFGEFFYKKFIIDK